MPNYGIYIVDAANVSVTGGVSLSGVTQGDGSHLVGNTITISGSDWRKIDIADNDSDFGDNDSSQTLDGAQVVNGITYNNGTRLEAEYSFSVTDGTDTWTLVGFNVNNSSPSYATIEGIAVIGGPGDFPPSGVPLAVTGADEFPVFDASTYATPICFASGTMIAVPGGEQRLVEDLRPGDRVRTFRGPAQRLIWVGARMFRATRDTAPVCFAPGVLGNAAPLRVSPQHRILVTGGLADVMFCEPNVLVPAKAFVNGSTVRQEFGGLVRYHHLLFERHQIVLSDGVPSESFLPGAASLATLSPKARDEVLALFPALRHNPTAYGPAAARPLRLFEAEALLAA